VPSLLHEVEKVPKGRMRLYYSLCREEQKLKRFERHQRVSIPDPRHRLDVLGNKAADIFFFVEINLEEQIKAASGGVNFRCDFFVGNGGCNVIGFSKFAFDLDEIGAHLISLFLGGKAAL
jgi:hypothetical protein